MSLTVPAVVNLTAVKPLKTACYDNNLVNSQGIFLGDKPLKFALPLLLLEVSMIFFLTHAVHYLLKHLGQCRIVSQMLTGILLGPSVLGQCVEFRKTVFPERATYILENLSLISLILFLFSCGIKTDLGLLKKPGRRAIIIGAAGAILPSILSLGLFYGFNHAFPKDLRQSTLVFDLATRLSLSSFPVIAEALSELHLLNTELGRIAMSASLITDVCSWFLLAAFLASTLIIKASNPTTAVEIVISFLAFTLFIVLIGRPVTIWITKKRTPAGELLGEGYFIGMLMAALLAALVTEMIGFKYILGPFMLGLALPGGMPLGVTMTERLDSFFTAMYLPVYVVLAGYRTDFKELKSFSGWGVLELVVVLCCVGKMVGSVAGSLYVEMPMRDAISLGLILNIKGIIEIAFISNWGDSEKATAAHYSALTASMMFITAFCSPLIKLLYNPSTRFVAGKRRTIEHAKPNSELRVVACLHSEDHVAPLLDLLEASHPSRDSPISLTVLHLTELAGRSAPVLRPHKCGRCNSSPPSASDRIANAFRYFEQQSVPGTISVHPFVSAAPYATMHNDVCGLALSRKARIILLPFHKHSDGAHEAASHAVREFNSSVLRFAPCSVAILVDRTLPSGTTCAHTNSLLQRVAVFFLGGPDDREALAYASRITGCSDISLTAVRISLREDESDAPSATKDVNAHDEAMIEEFRLRHIDNERVVYIEKTVADGEGTAAVIRSICEKFDLLIVGRRKGKESLLTSGLSDWSECPELGVIGDMLATTDFGGKVSILVVQQQKRMEGVGEGEEERFLRSGVGGGDVRRGGEEMKNGLIPPPTS
ncbi:cation/H(+) antiporter 15-like isoform X2 [Typha angustifolia]|uniref:cation/H(+) antiporter 15-like isoform X2 n=1 Tax=Typha angustifolia TaxID=59011 RepID=UPI003C2E15D1